jgi:hypothetical protein
MDLKKRKEPVDRMSRAQQESAYQPYDSNTDLDSDTDTDLDSDTDSTEDARIRREQDPRYAILVAPGPNLGTRNTKINPIEIGAPWDETTNIRSLADHVYLDPPKTTKTSLVSIKSTDRDTSVFPTPFRFQLKLPRVYKDVTKFQLVQMSFPNGANNVIPTNLFTSSLVLKLLSQGVPSSCLATCVSVINCSLASHSLGVAEQGRLTPAGEPLLGTIAVPHGNYSELQMASELTFQANSTPPLNLVSYDDFKDVFMNTRDISILFSEPGSSYYSAITNARYHAHTKENIMNTYYNQQHIDILPEITESVTYVAYYFPILKEIVASGRSQPFLHSDTLSHGDIVEAVMGPFQGFDSALYLALCQQNQVTLDSYRRHLTFEVRNINNYTWVYNSNERRYTTLHDSLHPSIRRDLSKQYEFILQQELSMSNLNQHSFRTIKTDLIGYQSILTHMERNLSSVIGSYSLASGYSYSGGSTHVIAGSTLHAAGLASDSDFSAMFCYTSTMGRIFNNCPGVRMTFTNFMDYHSTMSSYHHIVQSTSYAISSIHGSVYRDYHMFVSSKYNGVLPSSMIAHRTYLSNQGVPVAFVTDQTMYVPGQAVPLQTLQTLQPLQPRADIPITPEARACITTCCNVLQAMVNSWYSCVPVNTVINSLTYRLGLLNMKPTQFSILSTVAQITSTSNVNFLLQINDEQGFNNMDLTMPENYNISNEGTGQVKFVSGKILMADIGNTGVSQTVIQNPSIFENALGKLDRLDFKIYYDDHAMTPAWLYMPYFLSLNEWNATFQIDEQVGLASQDSGWGKRPTVAVPENPDSTPYLHYTHKDNPNN